MLKVSQTVLLLIGLLAIQPYNVDAVYTMKETCHYYGNGYIGDPSNCQNWGYCQDGKLISLGSCSPGYLYDMNTATCKVQSNVTCRINIRNVCSTLSTPQFIMNPDNCNEYCYCSSTISPSCANCPTNQMFDADSLRCVGMSDNKCPYKSVCNLVPNNAFVADPKNCGGFLTCEGGLGVTGQCSSGKGYNQFTGYCTSNYICYVNDAGINENLPDDPSACSVYAGTRTERFTDGQTCFGYYMCTSTSGPGTWGKCMFGTHFNPNLQECVTPYSYACPYNRCGNLNLPFVNKINTQCLEFTRCNNQMPSSSGKCTNVNKNYPYFNEYYNTCMPMMPESPNPYADYAVC